VGPPLSQPRAVFQRANVTQGHYRGHLVTTSLFDIRVCTVCRIPGIFRFKGLHAGRNDHTAAGIFVFQKEEKVEVKLIDISSGARHHRPSSHDF
jgi:hypothetical protein